uniref:Uncharacterized protein n=1 Tax=Rhizophora mucronata TaxID=61149 RepID=A0A2P2J2U2_RHIMU
MGMLEFVLPAVCPAMMAMRSQGMRKENPSMRISYARHAQQFVHFLHHILRQYGHRQHRVMMLCQALVRIKMCWKTSLQLVMLQSLRTILVLVAVLDRRIHLVMLPVSLFLLWSLRLLEKVLRRILFQINA